MDAHYPMLVSTEKVFETNEYQINDPQENSKIGKITEYDRLLAGKQILFGIGFIYVITVAAFLIHPEQGSALIEICKTVLPPLATLIIAFYFKDKN